MYVFCLCLLISLFRSLRVHVKIAKKKFVEMGESIITSSNPFLPICLHPPASRGPCRNHKEKCWSPVSKIFKVRKCNTFGPFNIKILTGTSHARTYLTAVLGFISLGFVLVRVRVLKWNRSWNKFGTSLITLRTKAITRRNSRCGIAGYLRPSSSLSWPLWLVRLTRLLTQVPRGRN